MRKQLIVTLLFFAISILFYGQDEWSTMSAKQKIKIAKKEQKAAKKDPEYLKLMDEALLLFQKGNYKDAQRKYQEAHDRRPDNVYPKVMLEDIDIAMSLPEEEKEEVIVEEPIQEPIEEEVLLVVTPEIAEPAVEKPQESEENNSKEEEIVETEVVALPQEVEKPTTVEKPKPQPERTTTRVQVQKEYLSDGVYKDSFKEGNADVEQIKIVKKGIETTYRKVSHSWGAIYYFKGENDISKKEWEDLLIEIEKR